MTNTDFDGLDNYEDELEPFEYDEDELDEFDPFEEDEGLVVIDGVVYRQDGTVLTEEDENEEDDEDFDEDVTPLDKIYDRLEKRPFRRKIVDEDVDE